MEKLLELLNEHAHIYADHYDDTGEEITITFFSHGDQCFQYVCDGKYETLVDDTVISKRFGFISWLVENGKIHREKIPAIIKVDWYLADGSDTEYYNMEESLLMLLAISDTPIEDLISYLK